jgi:hypothetical protein
MICFVQGKLTEGGCAMRTQKHMRRSIGAIKPISAAFIIGLFQAAPLAPKIIRMVFLEKSLLSPRMQLRAAADKTGIILTLRWLKTPKVLARKI